jgi:hypothetical protein
MSSSARVKDDLQLRPILHQLVFVAFAAYCLHVTLRAKLKPLARRDGRSGSSMSRAVMEKHVRGALPNPQRCT